MRRRTAWLAVVVALAGTVVTVPSPIAQVHAAPIGFVTSDGDGLLLDGVPYRFTGVNVYHANNTGGCWNPMSDATLGTSFDQIGSGRVIRAWFFQSLATTAGARDWTAFDRTMAFAASRGIKVIPTLGNQWGACDGASGGPGIDKNEAWYTTGYSATAQPGSTVAYRAWVAEIVARYKNDPTVLAWQLMNEAEVKPVVGDGLPCSVGAATILHDFAADVSGLVKSIDPNHLISLGTIGGGQCGTSFDEYATVHDIATIDLCEYHDYGPPTETLPGDEFNGLAKRVAQCDALDKPLIIGESGIKPSDAGGTFAGRASAFRSKLAGQLAAGIDGVLLWAWNPAGSTANDYDIGPSDPVLNVLGDVLAAPTPLTFSVVGGLGSGMTGPLIGTPNSMQARVSPDGETFARVDLTTDAVTTQSNIPVGSFPVASLGGERIVAISYTAPTMGTQLTEVDLSTGATTPLGLEAGLDASEFSTDPAHQKLVYFVSDFMGFTEFHQMDPTTGAISTIAGEPAVGANEFVSEVHTLDGVPWAVVTNTGGSVDSTYVMRWAGSWARQDLCWAGDAPGVLYFSGDGAGNAVVARSEFGGPFELCRLTPSNPPERFTADTTAAPGIDTVAEVRIDVLGRLWMWVYDDSGSSSTLLRAPLPPVPVDNGATITLGLVTIPSGAPDAFAVTGALAGSLSHGQQLTASVTAGTSNATVAVPIGWAVSGVVCDDTDSAAGAASGQVTFRTVAGEHVSCTVVMARTDADVSITKSVDQPTVVAGGTLVYTLTATNNGPGVATGVTMLDALPGGVTFASADAGCIHNGVSPGGDVTCTIGTVQSATSVSRSVRVTAGAAGVVTNGATVVTSSTDGNGTNNISANVTSTVTPADSNPCQTGPGNELWAFGDNSRGQLGSLVSGTQSSPVPVNLLRNVRQISAGAGSTFAVLNNGIVCSWGSTWPVGALGRPSGPTAPGFDFFSQPVPRPVVNQAGQTLIASRVIATYSTGAYAIVDPDGDGAGALLGWGFNAYGQVTPGAPSPATSITSATPVPLPGGREVRDVSSDGLTTAAITADHRFFTWGYDVGDALGPVPGNQTGLAPIDLTTYLPLRVGEVPERVFVLQHRTVVVSNQGRGMCFSTSSVTADPLCNVSFPVAFQAPGPIVSIDGAQYGPTVVMVVDDDNNGSGDVYVWGSHPGNGQTQNPTSSLVRAAVGEPVTQVAVGMAHVLAIGSSGQVWGWGNPSLGVLDSGGFGAEVQFPVPLGIDHASLIEAGSSSTFVGGEPTSVSTRYEAQQFVLDRGAVGGTDGEADGATAADRIETTITNSNSSAVNGLLNTFITEGPVDPAVAAHIAGYTAMGEMVSILSNGTSAPPPAADPFVVRFNLYLTPAQRAAQTAFGGVVQRIVVLRNNVVVPTCAEPNAPHATSPCVQSRTYDTATGNAVIVVSTTQFSRWTFAAAAPVVEAGGPYNTAEGTPVRLTGSVAGVPAAGRTTQWASPTGSFSDATRLDPQFTPFDNGAVTVSLAAVSAEQTGSDLATINVTNVKPVIGTFTAVVGAANRVDVSSSFTDPGLGDTHQILIGWGDQTTPSTSSSTVAGGTTITGTHNYANPGTYVVTITVTDDDGGVATAQRTVTLAAPNTAPVVRADMGVSGLEKIGFQTGGVVLTGSFTDAQNNGPFRASVRWNPTDAFTPLIVTSDRKFAAVWVYSGKAVRTATVRICDAAGACGTDDISISPNVTTKVTPIIQCVADRGVNPAGRYQARWSYSNPGSVALAVPVVANIENTFTTAPARRGQPEIFMPGRNNNVFVTTFNSGTQIWKLNGVSVTAKTTTTRC